VNSWVEAAGYVNAPPDGFVMVAVPSIVAAAAGVTPATAAAPSDAIKVKMARAPTLTLLPALTGWLSAPA
jgi:hypothetical protein